MTTTPLTNATWHYNSYTPETTPLTDFSDVVVGSFYEEAVAWAVSNGVTTGTGDTTFSPNDTCTRGQVVTFLWRAMGEPEPTSSTNPFTDVKEDTWYTDAVLWAVEQGITNGTCTEQQILTFLRRAAGEPKTSTTSTLGTGSWASTAISWADENGLLKDISFGYSNPSPRANVVTYLYRNAG